MKTTSPKQLRYMQREAIDAIYNYFQQKTGNPLISMATGCHAKGTGILMYDGSVKLVENVNVGDLLMGDDSTPRAVLSLVNNKENMYEVCPKKGNPFIVNEGHILSLSRTNTGVASKDLKDRIKNISIREYINQSKTFKHKHKLRRVPVSFPKIPSPSIDPWVVGALLGDGGIANGVSMHSADKEVLEYFYIFAKSMGLRIRSRQKIGNKCIDLRIVDDAARVNVQNKLTSKLRGIGIYGKKSGDKFIPFEYKVGSKETRLEILAGLLDTDGSLSRGNVYDYISKSEILSKDVVFIARSLGLSANIRKCVKKTQNGYQGTYWRVCISGDINIIPLKILRKRGANRLQKKNHLLTGFSLKKIGVGEYYGFSLSGNHLYLTSDFMVHHNTGKAMVVAAFCKEALEQWPDTNIIVATSVKELVAQNYAEMKELWPEAPASIYSAGVGVKDLSGKIIFAGIQSIYKKAFNIHRRIELLIIDEVQDVSENDGTMFRKFIDDLKLCNPDLKVIGLSATVYRLSQGMLTDGKNALFDEVIYDYGMLQGIKDGYLCPLVSKAMTQQFELAGVGIRSGDYIPGQLEKAVDKPEVTQAAVDELIKYGADRRCWLVFCVGISHAEHVRDEVRSRGYSCEMITAKTPKEERDGIFQQYKAGQIRCVTNVGVMTKGTNIPQIDLISMLRPTKSAGLLVQMAGRGTRLYPGKQNCLLLDHAGLLAEHGPLDMVKPKSKREKGEGVAPTKTCPECKTIVFAGCLVCPECDHEFEREAIKINTESTTDAVLSIHAKTEQYDVTSVSYYRHKKDGKPDSLRVEYLCGLTKSFRDWWLLEHSYGARTQACLKWSLASGTKVPNSVTEALERVSELKKPQSIEVKKVGKYYEIVRENYEH